MKDKVIHVLSIEDEPAYAMLIQEKLAEAQRVGWDLPRFEVEHVARLEPALERLDDGEFDVVLSDLDLPDSRAGETVATLREHIPQMPLVVLTGREDEVLAHKSVRAGVQDYLYKNEATGSLLARTMMYAIERQQAHGELEQRVDERTVALKTSKQALQREKDKAERYLNVAPSIIIALDTEGHITLLNEMGADILECDQDAVVGQNWFDEFLPERIREEIKTVYKELMTGHIQPVEYVENVVLTGQGNEKVIRWHNTLLRDEDGEITGLLSSGEDITERRRAQEVLQRRNRELALLHRASQAFGATLDVDQVVATFLEEMLGFLGVTGGAVWLLDPITEEWVCQHANGVPEEIIRGWDLKPDGGIGKRVVRYGESFIVPDTQAAEYRLGGGEQELVGEMRSILGAPLQIDEEVIGVIEAFDVEVDRFTLEDLLIVERLAASAVIAIENARLYKRTQQESTKRRRMEEELRRSNRDLEQFAYAVSHDLQAPLRTMTGYLNLLRQRYDDRLDDKDNAYIDRTMDSAGRMQEMIEALLDLSRVGTRGRNFAPVNCESILEHVLVDLGKAIKENNAEVTYDSLPTVMADRAQLAQVFQNLIANGIKFRRQGRLPQVHVSAISGGGVNGSSPSRIMALASTRSKPSASSRSSSACTQKMSTRAWVSGWRCASASWSGTAGASGSSRSLARGAHSPSRCQIRCDKPKS